MILEFPAEHPVLEDLSLEALPPAPAPVLMPSAPPPPEPAPARPKPNEAPQFKTAAGIIAAAVVVTIVLVVTIVATTKRTPPGGTGDVAAPGTTTSVETATAADPTTTTAEATTEDSARSLLEAEVAQDRPQVEALVESWVPQLSSKRLGLVADGTSYDNRAIWANFTNLRAQHPGALLLWSGDYSSFRQPDFWVTVVPQSYGSGEAANSWCDSTGIGKDDCYAKRITHTGGSAGSTVLRK
ncbi:zinc ribbon domain-containing protein [Amycolatopsis sp. OK19-0408]|uniref:Zinc ribbon domain-containing protein n=1 Tax=Amycolatopsis iheyensis TaxID=2945988 RepID=A0A9X2SGH6_9PSEU|nr:zinc ribbon domain-containing protein [Amycolatopsis iheyensis]MCR6481762.1 zinc ribbon domain-containing protein [Amycolatopsis iheyensis]